MKKMTLPDRKALKDSKRPYLDVELAATRSSIDQARRKGFRLKTIWRSLTESGDITGSYTGFLKALNRNGNAGDYIDEISRNEPVIESRRNRSELESEAAMAEAKEALAARSKAK